MPPKNNAPLGQFEQVVDKLKNANNVLVTVSSSPTLDQLSACLGLTLVLNKLGKHATAVFSGKVPSAIEFLKPETTLEKNTNSLRDFIIALDKSKADKLRYKVEDDVVKIFITPYKTSISDKDLQFSQGDFNVDVVVTLGVHNRTDLDTAITAHGRILHDATVIGIDAKSRSQLAAIDWVETRASSLSEMVTDIAMDLKRDILDNQIATALLTGVVVETDRFRNEKVSPHTMSISGVLMAAGASTQLVATKLEESRKAEIEAKRAAEEAKQVKKNADGSLKIKHGEQEVVEEDEESEIPPVKEEEEEPVQKDNIHIDDQGTFHALAEREYLKEAPADEQKPEEEFDEAPSGQPFSPTPSMITEPPKLGGQLTANSVPESQQYSASTDPLSSTESAKAPLLGRKDKKESKKPDEPAKAEETPASVDPVIPLPPEEQMAPVVPPEPKKPTVSEVEDILAGKDQTLDDIEKKLDSPHLDANSARQAATAAAEAADSSPKPAESHGASDVNLGKESEDEKSSDNPPPPVPPPMMPPTS